MHTSTCMISGTSSSPPPSWRTTILQYAWISRAYPITLVTGTCLLILSSLVPGCTRLPRLNARLNAAHLLRPKGTLGQAQSNNYYSLKLYKATPAGKAARCRLELRQRAQRRPRCPSCPRCGRRKFTFESRARVPSILRKS
jgi:hypothetical protein